MISRREFFGGAAAAVPLAGQPAGRYLVLAEEDATFRQRLARRELLRGLVRLRLPGEPRLAGRDETARADDLVFDLRVDSGRFRGPEEYEISAAGSRVTLTAAGEQALLYAVFDFLERQGAFFGIDGESYPIDDAAGLALPARGAPWTGAPRFAVRGLLPWPDFLNCITVYNEDDFQAYFEAMLRMRFNTFGMHVYTGAQQWVESYLSFEFAGAGHLAFLDNSASHRWGYLPERTSRFGMGAAQFFDGEVFGSDATRLARDPWETAERTRTLLRGALDYARRLGIRTGVGFEPYQIPDEIWRALPPEVKPAQLPVRSERGPRFDVESVTARKLLEARLAQLLEAYPDVNHVWLWEDEGMSWASQRTGVPLSATPFLQAHEFLRRHAPEKRLVLSGWGGVVRHFTAFHRQLPGDVVFAALNDMTGWDPVHEAFGKLKQRERWPIPWLEDDPGMWQPQLHVNRFAHDMNRAQHYGCQGLIGIHWRHRIVDPTAGFQARYSWRKDLRPDAYYRAYAGSQAADVRANALAGILAGADRHHRLLSTGTGAVRNGHAVTRAFSGDYSEAFNFWSAYQPTAQVMESQRKTAAAMRALADSAEGAAERERLEYLARHVEMQVPYAECWVTAHQLHELLQRALRLRQDEQAEAARELVAREGVPLWLRMAPEVRATMLHFQRIVATRNDLGTLASMHNKFVRLALVRLRLSMQEFLGELPPETESMLERVTAPDATAPPRVFLPVRPGMLAAGEKVRVAVVAPGGEAVNAVTLHARPRGAAAFTAVPARLRGRRTYEATLGPFEAGPELVEYYVTARIGTADVRTESFFLTLL